MKINFNNVHVIGPSAAVNFISIPTLANNLVPLYFPKSPPMYHFKCYQHLFLSLLRMFLFNNFVFYIFTLNRRDINLKSTDGSHRSVDSNNTND